jgi:hypothetical protein
VFDAETTAFMEAGSALIVGTVHPDGTPHAGRAWALDVVEDDDRTVVRLLLDIDDLVTIAHVAAGGAVAVTASSVRSLRSLQMKGRSLGIDASRPEDDERMGRYIEEFFGDIVDTDATDRDILEGIRPRGHVPALIEVHERFVQTPGPGAGARLA